jgi:nitroimidazol reductase NimA-like FMN-containing flavoprotein (pyridoxamine 5'-phosphate oxidase superfamily)
MTSGQSGNVAVGSQDYSQVRRADRAVADDEWIVALLNRAATGFLATVYEGQPFINSNLFVYDRAAHAIYLHTARKGRTRTNVEYDPRVCFTVAEMGRLLPADVALEFSVEYCSVVVFGRAHIVEELAEATAALQMLLDKYFAHLQAGHDYRPPVPEELVRTTVLRVDVESWSGKKKEVGEFPGAFGYPGPLEEPG